MTRVNTFDEHIVVVVVVAAVAAVPSSFAHFIRLDLDEIVSDSKLKSLFKV